MRYALGLFNDSFPPVIDGVALAVRNYAYWLQKTMGDAYVIAPFYPGYEDREEFRVLRFFSRPLPFNAPYRYGIPHIDLQFQKRLRRVRFDLVHAHSPMVAGGIAMSVKRRLNIPLVATFHTKLREDIKRFVRFDAFVSPILRSVVRFYESADQVWLPNRSTGDTLREYGYQGKMEVVLNGTDIESPDDLHALREAANSRLAIDGNKPVFLFVGQHVWEKNHRMLIEALQLLRQKHSGEFLMLFIGQGYAQNEMRKMAAQSGLEAQVRFLGPILDRAELGMYYARANLFLLPSLYDNSPVTLREAAAFRLPALLIKGSTASEDIFDGKNGFTAENDAQAFTARIASVMRERELLERVGRKARETLFRSWRTVAEEVKERYLDLIRTYSKRKIA